MKSWIASFVAQIVTLISLVMQKGEVFKFLSSSNRGWLSKRDLCVMLKPLESSKWLLQGLLSPKWGAFEIPLCPQNIMCLKFSVLPLSLFLTLCLVLVFSYSSCLCSSLFLVSFVFTCCFRSHWANQARIIMAVSSCCCFWSCHKNFSTRVSVWNCSNPSSFLLLFSMFLRIGWVSPLSC